MNNIGVDLSGWNDVYNYSKLAEAGCDFAILKVITANLKADKRFETHFKGCGAADIPVIGVYTYLYTNTTTKALAAAKACHEVLESVCSGTKYDKPKKIWLDIEDVVMRGIGARMVDIVNVYRDYLEPKGYEVGIYTYQYFYTKYIEPYKSHFSELDFWMAKYPSTADRTLKDAIPKRTLFMDNMVGWQYSSKCVANGANGYLDANIWYEDIEEKNGNEEITAEYNPFTEPTTTVKLGSRGEGAKWVQWYLWRFGLLLTDGVPDSNKITGLIDEESASAIGISQQLLGTNADKIVGKITRMLYNKTIQ